MDMNTDIFKCNHKVQLQCFGEFFIIAGLYGLIIVAGKEAKLVQKKLKVKSEQLTWSWNLICY
jgi:hypothetical protein